MGLTVADVLELPATRAGRPEVLAGAGLLGRSVRWVHVSDVPNVSEVLAGGELVLTTGQAMAASARSAVALVEQLAGASAAGLVVELGPSYPRVQPEAVARAEDLGLPLVCLRAQVRFVEVTEAAHRRLVAAQYEQVEFAKAMHEAFTRLSLAGAAPDEIVRGTGDLTGRSVVLEDLGRRVIAFHAADGDVAGLLDGWERRSRLARPFTRDDPAPGADWAAADVGARGRSWARLVAVDSRAGDGGEDAREAHDRVLMVLERAAEALELHRRTTRDELTERLRAQDGLLRALQEGSPASEADAIASLTSLGIRPGRRYVGVAVRRAGRAPQDERTARRHLLRLSEQVAQTLRGAGADGLIGVLGGGQVGVVLCLPSAQREERALRSLAAGLREAAGDDVRLGVGEPVTGLLDARESLRSACVVVDVAVSMPPAAQGFRRHSDVRIRGLIHALRDDPRLQGFAEVELSRVLAHDARTQDGTLDLLRLYLAVDGNKAELARVSHRNRSSLYPRLKKLEALLGVPLDDHESRLSLGVALLAHDQLSGGRSGRA
ncbi:PucR family transcriptional regulator ligand-binding domain-containing protein [Spirillospora sp. NPDC052242]